jgi:signal peptidase I
VRPVARLATRCFSRNAAILGLSTKKAIRIIYDIEMKGIKAVFFALITALIIKLFVFDFIIAQGDSMEPAVKSGTVLIISRMRYGLRLHWRQNYLIRWGEPKIGEVVVFYTPTGELVVKRCVQMTERESFYAEGDNVNTSYDSRAYGPVPVENIIGKVLGY